MPKIKESERNITSNLLPIRLKRCLILTYVILVLECIILLLLRNRSDILAQRNMVPPLTPLSITILPTLTLTNTPTKEPTLAPTLGIGSNKRSEKDGMTMLYVPEGEFVMGADPTTPGINPDELPAHAVYLDAYWIDQTEVTNMMYAKFLNENGNQEESGTFWLDAEDPNVGLVLRQSAWIPRSDYQQSANRDFSTTTNFPAFEITWHGARAYCEWAGKRLPTEAEWEKAARGTDGRIYPWGNSDDECMAEVMRCAGWITGYELDVGQWPAGASPYGTLDMLGSVWEWTADFYDENYYRRSSNENPIGPETGKYKTIRGSSWEYEYVQITKRSKLSPELSDAALGFRCVMDED